MNYLDKIKHYLNLEKAIIDQLDKEEINKAINLLEETRKKGSNVYVFGNGGSASTAEHMENDFNKGISEKSAKKYNFKCLNSNMAIIMAIANDNGYDKIFVQQLEDKVCPDDVIIAISGSGNSINTIKAAQYAKDKGCKIIAMTGYDGGELKKIADVSLHVPIDNMQITEDIHIIFNHMMMYIINE